MIPLEDFFRKPEKAMVRISPDGSHISYMEPWKRRLNVHIMNVETEDAWRITSSEERDIAGYLWLDDSQLLYLKDKGGDENHHLYKVDIDGKNEVDLTPFEETMCRLVDKLENVDDHILISLNKRNKQVFDVYRINVRTGDMEMVCENPGNFLGYGCDHDGKLRVAIASDGTNRNLYYRDDESAEWALIGEYNFKEWIAPLDFYSDNSKLYVASNLGRDKFGIFLADPNSMDDMELIFEHPDVDVTNTIYSKRQKKLTGVQFETEYTEYKFFDSKREGIQEFLDKELKGLDSSIMSLCKDETRCIVVSSSDQEPGTYYLLDTIKFELKKLFDMKPWLNKSDMSKMKPISYKSRDGLTIHGYLTIPKESGGTNLPLVVHPHGGPFGIRDSWGFSPVIQFLADRGYAVLQMNFRGSGGYGSKFEQIGYKQWGKSMQDDITDGVSWAVSEGIADKDRVSIFGGSYGGYATLAGLTFTPEVYRCGVDVVGPSSLFTLMDSIPPYWEPIREQMYEQIGHPEDDKDFLTEISPLFHIDKIKAPLLIAQGANDPRVKQHESDQIVDALENANLDVDYVLKENEGHGFSNEENILELYGRMEKFLDKHMS